MSDEKWQAGFRAGWEASGEGHNGEYPDEGVPWEKSAGHETMMRMLRLRSTMVEPPEFKQFVAYIEGSRAAGQVVDRAQDWYQRNEHLLPPVAALELREILLGKHA